MASAGASGSFSRAIWIAHTAAYYGIPDEADNLVSADLRRPVCSYQATAMVGLYLAKANVDNKEISIGEMPCLLSVENG